MFPFLAYPRLCKEFQKHVDITESMFILYNILIEIKEINTSNIATTRVISK